MAGNALDLVELCPDVNTEMQAAEIFEHAGATMAAAGIGILYRMEAFYRNSLIVYIADRFGPRSACRPILGVYLERRLGGLNASNSEEALYRLYEFAEAEGGQVGECHTDQRANGGRPLALADDPVAVPLAASSTNAPRS